MATVTAESPPKTDKKPLTIETLVTLNGHDLTPEERREAVDWVNDQWMHRGVYMLDFDIVTGAPLIGALRVMEYANQWHCDAPSVWLTHLPPTSKTVTGWQGQPVELVGRWLRVFKFPPVFTEDPNNATWMGVFNTGPEKNNYGFFEQFGDAPIMPIAWYFDYNELFRWVAQVASHQQRPMFLPTREQITARMNAAVMKKK